MPEKKKKGMSNRTHQATVIAKIEKYKYIRASSPRSVSFDCRPSATL